VPTRRGLLECIERYFAAAPLPDARIEAVGGLDVPVGDPAWPYPARPRPGAGPVTVDDVRAAVLLQEGAGIPVGLEWIGERSPEAAAAARAAGLTVDELPLLVADEPVDLLMPSGVRLYLVGADDPDLARYERVAAVAFAHPGGPGDVGDAPVDTSADISAEAAARTAVLRERIAAGRTVMMVAVEDGEPVAVGSHQPVDVDGSEVSEIVGIATLPRLRARGLGAGLASALTAHARETADLVFLTAGDDDVARVYERVGFARLATTGVAEPPDVDSEL
jgi:predicted N-acetyltransferase YhbS